MNTSSPHPDGHSALEQSQRHSRVVLSALLALWFVCFALHINQLGAGRLVEWEQAWVNGLFFSKDELT